MAASAVSRESLQRIPARSRRDVFLLGNTRKSDDAHDFITQAIKEAHG